MCGLVSIFAYSSDAPSIDRNELLRINNRMILRGPDGSGIWISDDNKVGIAHRRLAIIDLSENGSQPMISSDGNLVITFNGEIYNYKKLRSDLENKGHHFRSNSDTEVLLKLYEDKGPEMLHELRGMYAFSIWDNRKRGLFLARDPFGIKPLYYADNGKTIRVASQVKALLAGDDIDTSPEPAGHVGYFLWGHVPEPYTLYKGIRALPAGCYAWLQQSPAQQQTFTIHQYCSIPEELRQAEQRPLSLTDSELREYLRATLLDSVNHHLLADVTVGIFLSAGLDSTTLAALASELVKDQLHTVTLGFREYQGTNNDEVPLAELVAKRYGSAHSTIWVNKEEFQREIPHLLDVMDQPSVDGINSYFVSKAAVQAGLKVAISGLGGDELFGSYPSFQQIPSLVQNVKAIASVPGLGRGFRLVTAPFLKHFTSPKYAGIFEYGGGFAGAYLLRRGMYMPWELPDLLDAEMVAEGWGELQTLLRLEETTKHMLGAHQKVSSLELCWYMRNQLLRDSDWASMAHSLEVRVPFVDLDVLRKLAPLFVGNTDICKQKMAETPRNALPNEVTMRPKTGFSVPTQAWLQGSRLKEETSLRGWSKQVHSQQCTQAGSSHIRYHRPTIIVFRVGQLGDTLISMPAINLIRKRFPLHRMLLLTDRHAGKSGYVSSWDVLGPTGWFDDVIYYEPSSSFVETAKNLFTLYPKLSLHHPEHVFDLSPDRTRGQSVRDRFFFSQIIGTANYHQFGSTNIPARLPDTKLPYVVPEWKRLLSIARDSSDRGGEDDNSQFEFPLSDASKLEARSVLDASRLGCDAYIIGIGPGSKMPAKRWPSENYFELGKLLLSRFPDIQLVVLGGKEDAEIGDKLCSQWGERAHNFAGLLSIFGSAAVLKKCVCYVGNDTGTMHLAGMSGTPCVAIFSARDYPGKWEPYGEGHTILRTDCSCDGCMLEVCAHDNICLRQLSVDLVFKAVEGKVNR